MKMTIDGWGNNLRFSSAHFIPDLGKCSRLHGHDYAVSIELEGDLKNGILIDYGDVKRIARKILEQYDHRVLIPTRGTLSVANVQSNHVSVEYSGKTMSFFMEDVCFIDTDVSSSENLASLISFQLKKELSAYENLRSLSLTVYEGPSQGSSFQVNLK